MNKYIEAGDGGTPFPLQAHPHFPVCTPDTLLYVPSRKAPRYLEITLIRVLRTEVDTFSTLKRVDKGPEARRTGILRIVKVILVS